MSLCRAPALHCWLHVLALLVLLHSCHLICFLLAGLVDKPNKSLAQIAKVPGFSAHQVSLETSLELYRYQVSLETSLELYCHQVSLVSVHPAG